MKQFVIVASGLILAASACGEEEPAVSSPELSLRLSD